MNGPRIWSLGSLMIDQTIEVPHLPERSSDVVATSSHDEVGGGFNLAAAVVRQGVPCTYGGTYGVGRNSEIALRALAAEDIDVALPPDLRGDIGVCLTLVEPDGERTFVTVIGVESLRTVEQLSALQIGEDDWVSVSGYDLHYPVGGEATTAWLRTEPAGRLFCDPGPLVAEIPEDRLRTALQRAAVLSCNRREAQLLTGCDDVIGVDLVEELRTHPWINPGTLIVVREGAAGCVATGGALGQRIVSVPAPQVRVVDTVGAGDTHAGVLMARMVQGVEIEQALHDANIAAADSVTRKGSATAPRRP